MISLIFFEANQRSEKDLPGSKKLFFKKIACKLSIAILQENFRFYDAVVLGINLPDVYNLLYKLNH